MLIINADDWGRSVIETDSALTCCRAGRVTSVSAMVFMEDSERAAALALEHGVDAGLHLNLSQPYSGNGIPSALTVDHAQIVKFMKSSRYALLLYHPGLRRQFRDVFRAQWDEFVRLYKSPPSHVDGHQHRHLCANMLVNEIIPRGQKVRRNFSFWPSEKSLVNRIYRGLVDRWLGRRYRLSDYFFSLGQLLAASRLQRAAKLAETASVELMAHSAIKGEYNWLMSDEHLRVVSNVITGSYSAL